MKIHKYVGRDGHTDENLARGLEDTRVVAARHRRRQLHAADRVEEAVNY